MKAVDIYILAALRLKVTCLIQVNKMKKHAMKKPAMKAMKAMKKPAMKDAERVRKASESGFVKTNKSRSKLRADVSYARKLARGQVKEASTQIGESPLGHKCIAVQFEVIDSLKARAMHI